MATLSSNHENSLSQFARQRTLKDSSSDYHGPERRDHTERNIALTTFGVLLVATVGLAITHPAEAHQLLQNLAALKDIITNGPVHPDPIHFS